MCTCMVSMVVPRSASHFGGLSVGGQVSVGVESSSKHDSEIVLLIYWQAGD